MSKGRLGLLAIAIALVLDQTTKQIALATFSPTDPIVLLPILELTLAWNRGVSFGMFGSGGMPALGFVAISLVISGFLAWQMAKAETWIVAVGYGLIVGGAVGNVVDRVIYGAVIDFILAHWGAWAFPVFNIADTAITCGVALILFDSLWPRRASTTS